MAVCAIGGLLTAVGDSSANGPVGTGLATGHADPAIASLVSGSALDPFYRARGYRPVWTKAAAERLIETLENAAEDGLDSQRYDLPLLRSFLNDPAGAAELEVALSRVWARYVADLRTSSSGTRMTYVDAVLAPQVHPVAILTAAAAAPSLVDHLAQARRMHPLYEEHRSLLLAYRKDRRNPAGVPDEQHEHDLLANMNQLRALPAEPGRRYVLVDANSARLWMVEDGVVHDSMRVIVGKPSQQTPSLAGLIRFVVHQPYWNLPQDLVRVRAARVLRDGPATLERERLQLLADWSPDARVIGPAEVDWTRVARGEQKLRMRQMPGTDNMMGAVKFMLPNRLGIYLHDTPDKSSFARADRRLSSGCVRLEDAERLGRWLFDGREPERSGIAEERIDLPEPVPVYIIHLAALPDRSELARHRSRDEREPI